MHIHMLVPSVEMKRKKAMCDVAIAKRIHSVFRRALQKRSGDISLWLTYIDVAKFLGSRKALTRVFGM